MRETGRVLPVSFIRRTRRDEIDFCFLEEKLYKYLFILEPAGRGSTQAVQRWAQLNSPPPLSLTSCDVGSLGYYRTGSGNIRPVTANTGREDETKVSQLIPSSPLAYPRIQQATCAAGLSLSSKGFKLDKFRCEDKATL